MALQPPIRRRAWSRPAYYLSLVPLYLLFLPLCKVLELAGLWPRIFSRGMKGAFVWSANLQPGTHDVVICSYFKSGTNWMLQITTQIAWRGRAEFEHIHDLVPWPEMRSRRSRPFAVDINDVNPTDVPTGLRPFKTHLAPGDVPLNDKARYICVIRDPRAVFKSSYHFIHSSGMGPMMPSAARWLDMYVSEDALFGCWADFTAACWALRAKPNVLFLTYEQLTADLPGSVARIAQFMGVTLTAGELAAVITQSTFAHMKTIGHKFDPIGVGPPWAKPHGSMIRQGEARSGAELLPGTHARIDAYMKQRLQELHSDFPFDDYYPRK